MPESAFKPAHSSTTTSGGRIGDILVATGVLDRETVEQAAQEARRSGVRIGETLMHDAGAEEREIFRALAKQNNLEYADTEELLAIADPELSEALSERYLVHHRVLPIAREGDIAVVATTNPQAPLREIAMALNAKRVRPYLITDTNFRRLRTAFKLVLTKKSSQVAPEEVATRDLMSTNLRLDAEMVALLDAILLDAIGERSSDIHFEIYEGHVRIRIRVDGDLRDVKRFNVSSKQLLAIVNIVKINAGLDISERRLPQGGRFSTRAGTSIFDLRVQTQPAMHGEHVVIRLLPHDVKLLEIEDLGFPPEISARYRKLLGSPTGLILVVGPTGSGKSTTLYAGLQVLAEDATRKVITVEDPIEYAIANIQQTHVRPEIGFSFANAMRAFVRQDPDVVFVGEIRDGETALEAIRASETGHLVLSTLHCNDSIDAVQRLVDLGMHPNSIASELLAVLSQRLAKRLCPGCKTEVTPDPRLARDIFPHGVPAGFRCYRGKGCARCSGYGTHGRIAAVEFLNVGRELRTAISQRMPIDELRDISRTSGIIPLRDNALWLVQQGVIALEELPDLLSLEQMSGA